MAEREEGEEAEVVPTLATNSASEFGDLLTELPPARKPRLSDARASSQVSLESETEYLLYYRIWESSLT